MRLLTWAVLPNGEFMMVARMVGVTDEEFDALIAGEVPIPRIRQVSESVREQFNALLGAEPMGRC